MDKPAIGSTSEESRLKVVSTLLIAICWRESMAATINSWDATFTPVEPGLAL
jgi:hypothetical protein